MEQSVHMGKQAATLGMYVCWAEGGAVELGGSSKVKRLVTLKRFRACKGSLNVIMRVKPLVLTMLNQHNESVIQFL